MCVFGRSVILHNRSLDHVSHRGMVASLMWRSNGLLLSMLSQNFHWNDWAAILECGVCAQDRRVSDVAPCCGKAPNMNTGTLSSRFLIKSPLTQEEAVRESDGKKLKTRAEYEADEMMGSKWEDSSRYYCVWCKLTASWPFVPAISQDTLACMHTLLHPDMPWTATSAAPSQSKHLQNVSALSSSSSLFHSYQLQIPAARLIARPHSVQTVTPLSAAANFLLTLCSVKASDWWDVGLYWVVQLFPATIISIKRGNSQCFLA